MGLYMYFHHAATPVSARVQPLQVKGTQSRPFRARETETQRGWSWTMTLRSDLRLVLGSQSGNCAVNIRHYSIAVDRSLTMSPV